MPLVVIDASVAAKWLGEEELADVALSLLHSGYTFAVPDLFFIELASIARKLVQRGKVTFEDAEEFLELAHGLDARAFPSHEIAKAAFQFASTYGITPYDATYVVVARRANTHCVTADRRFYEKLTNTALHESIVWIEDFVPSVM